MDAPAADVEPLVTLREAARRFGIGHGVLTRAAEIGELIVYTPSVRRRVRLSDVERWLGQRRSFRPVKPFRARR